MCSNWAHYSVMKQLIPNISHSIEPYLLSRVIYGIIISVSEHPGSGQERMAILSQKRYRSLCFFLSSAMHGRGSEMGGGGV